MKISILLLAGVFAAGNAQLFNRYNGFNAKPFTRPFQPVQYTPKNYVSNRNYNDLNDGRYVHSNEGQYYHDNSGAYIHQDEKYRHQEDKYKHYEPKYVAESRPAKRIVPAENLYGINPGLKKGNAAGLYDNRNYRIIRKIENVGSDKFNYLYETENGIYAEEQGKMIRVGNDMESIIAQGFFTYTGPDSIVYTVKYTADDKGFVAEGAHLPTPPPVPEYISRALEYQRSHGFL